jgi:hypothetical protein
MMALLKNSDQGKMDLFIGVPNAIEKPSILTGREKYSFNRKISGLSVDKLGIVVERSTIVP